MTFCHMAVFNIYSISSFKSNERLISYLHKDNNIRTTDLSPLTAIPILLPVIKAEW